MECHRCPHRKNVESGMYREVPFETTPCASCELDAEPDYVVAFDEDRPGVASDAAFFADEPQAAPEGSARTPMIWELVVTLLRLQPRTRDVVCWRYAGFKYRDIAMLQHVTVTAVELRHRNALKRHPLLRALFPSKAGRQRSRKRHAHAGAEGRS